MACRCTNCSGNGVPVIGHGGLAGHLGQESVDVDLQQNDFVSDPTGGGATVDDVEEQEPDFDQADQNGNGNGENGNGVAATGMKINPLLLLGGGAVVLFLLTR